MSHPVSEKSALVVSAHSADFVWRAGGAIALHALQGYQVHVVCLSFGERGESAKLWRKRQHDRGGGEAGASRRGPGRRRDPGRQRRIL